MSERIKTLLLEANGTHWAAVVLDTLGRGALNFREHTPSWVSARPRLRKLFGERYGDASYMADWREAFCASPRLSIEVCNITDLFALGSTLKTIAEYDLIVVLHSAAGDRMAILNRCASWLQNRRGTLAVFIGNEYDLMREKIGFLRSSGADYVCSQLPYDVALKLYEGCGADVLAMPHALNPRVYTDHNGNRPIDLGFVGDLYDRLIGDRERTSIVEFFATRGPEFQLRCDIHRARMPRAEWAEYLNRCIGTIGAESGTYYLQRDGEALRCARALLNAEPDRSFDEVYARCFERASATLNGKAISSRHFEPIGTRTCQLLIRGRYNDILQADVHYIAVDRDLSNIEDAIDKFKDPACRTTIADAAYHHVMAAHTYRHRVEEFVSRITRQHLTAPAGQAAGLVS